MKNTIFALAACAATCASASHEPRATSHGSDGDVRALFKTPPPGYGEVPFWWWTGEKLDKERLAWQIDQLHKAGVSGAQVNYSHRRSHGWNTAPVEPDVFTDEWWDCFRFAAEECAKRGMGIGLSGYTLDWPGRENLWKRLGISTPETCGRVLAAKPDANAPHGLRIEPRTASATLDPLNPRSARLVIERFFEPFLAHLPKESHKALNYFFQDELRLAGNARLWCDDFPAEFKKRKGYDVVPLLAALFKDVGADTAKIRIDYNDVMTQLEGERYFKPLFDWHASRGMIWACDPASRGRRPDEFGDYMRAMRWYTAPGFDTPFSSSDPIKNKMGSSIAHLYERPRTWVEGYHSLGWSASTATIFDSSVHNYVYGASLFNLHGLYYSTYGGWWEWAPPCYHFRMPYWAHLPATLKYFERLSWLLTRGSHVCDAAILSPLEPVVVDAKRGAESVKLAHDAVDRLAVKGATDCDFIDADSLARAEIENCELRVAGERYRALVLPGMFAIKPESLAKARAFAAAGGKVIALGECPAIDGAARELSFPLVKTPDFAAPAGTKVLHRRLADYDVFYVVDHDKTADLTFRASGRAEIWDAWDGTARRFEGARANADGTTTLALEGRPGVPRLVVFARDAAAPKDEFLSAVAPDETIRLPDTWSFTLKPTMYNKWGDFRFPAFDGCIGAEIRQMKFSSVGTFECSSGNAAKPLRNSNTQTLKHSNTPHTLGYGPQFIDAAGAEFRFSWRYGVEGKPCFQDKHHGLNERVGDDFFILGPYEFGAHPLYDVAPPKDAKPTRETFRTFVFAPQDLAARVVAHGTAPFDEKRKFAAPEPISILLDGKRVAPGDVVSLKRGYSPLEVTYESFGRASVVLMRTDVASAPSKMPLSMKWLDDPAVLKFDPFGGRAKSFTCRATLPPACRKLTFDLHGEVVAARIGGKKATAKKDAAGRWTVAPAAAEPRTAELELDVCADDGYVGAGAFGEAIACECGTGEMKLGDWGEVDGLHCYSGGATYETAFTLTAAQAAKRIVLDLGGVGASAGVRVDGGDEIVRTCPPWEVELTGRARAGANVISVTVYNTLNNHCQTIPTRYKRVTRDAPSGLLGPVTLKLQKR